MKGLLRTPTVGILFLCLALGICGPSRADGPAEADTVESFPTRVEDPGDSKAESELKIVCFGDSTTALRSSVEKVYAARLPGILARHDLESEVLNAGLGGSHSGHLSDNSRFDRQHGLDRLDVAVRAHDPDVVVIQFGVNDSWVDSKNSAGPSRIPLADYQENLGQMASILRRDGARVILMTPNEIGDKFDVWRQGRLAKYANAVRELARKGHYELVDVWDAYEQFERTGVESRSSLMLDDMHPNDRGHALLAELLADQVLKPMQHVDARPVTVFDAGVTAIDGMPRSPACFAQFREAGVVVTNAGVIVVTAQGREASAWSDRSGQDLVCRSSSDNGTTWSAATLVVASGNQSICPNAMVYDRDTNATHILYNVFEWDFKDPESRKAMDGRECRQFHIASLDTGKTWGPPREITEMLGSDRRVTVFGSGEGIQLRHGEHSGRLIIPGGFQRPWGNRMFYSDDHGETWLVGQVAPRAEIEGLNVRLENKVAERGDGVLVLNARHTPQRVRAFSKDGGDSWIPEQVDPALEAISCNGALLCVQDAEGKDVLLCSVPTGPKRSHGAVYASFDGGYTWPVKKVVVPGPFAYSSLVPLADGRIGLLYEAQGHLDLELIRFPLQWLTRGAGDRKPTKSGED